MYPLFYCVFIFIIPLENLCKHCSLLTRYLPRLKDYIWKEQGSNDSNVCFSSSRMLGCLLKKSIKSRFPQQSKRKMLERRCDKRSRSVWGKVKQLESRSVSPSLCAAPGFAFLLQSGARQRREGDGSSGGGGGKAVNLEPWSGMLLVSEHASSSSYVRPL